MQFCQGLLDDLNEGRIIKLVCDFVETYCEIDGPLNAWLDKYLMNNFFDFLLALPQALKDSNHESFQQMFESKGFFGHIISFFKWLVCCNTSEPSPPVAKNKNFQYLMESISNYKDHFTKVFENVKTAPPDEHKKIVVTPITLLVVSGSLHEKNDTDQAKKLLRKMSRQQVYDSSKKLDLAKLRKQGFDKGITHE